jgi:Flp pilus assembly protein TadG
VRHARFGGLIASLAKTVIAFLSAPHARSGATAVEFGAIAPVFLVVLLGILEIGRVLFTQGVLYFSAEETTRYATVNFDATTQELQTVAESKFLMIDPERISQFNVSSVLNTDDQTRLVTVEIAYDFETLTPIGLGPLTLVGHSRGFIVSE